MEHITTQKYPLEEGSTLWSEQLHTWSFGGLEQALAIIPYIWHEK